jgi:hypothetical protein
MQINGQMKGLGVMSFETTVEGRMIIEDVVKVIFPAIFVALLICRLSECRRLYGREWRKKKHLMKKRNTRERKQFLIVLSVQQICPQRPGKLLFVAISNVPLNRRSPGYPEMPDLTF